MFKRDKDYWFRVGRLMRRVSLKTGQGPRIGLEISTSSRFYARSFGLVRDTLIWAVWQVADKHRKETISDIRSRDPSGVTASWSEMS